MRKNTNSFVITGWLHSFGESNGRNMLEARVTGPDAKTPNTEYIKGVMNIAIDDKGLNVIPVNFTHVTGTYASSGRPNPNFTTLKKILTESKTWVAVGKDEAVKVKVEGSIGLNEFYVTENDETRLVSTKVNEGSFVNIVNELPAENARATFRSDFLITKVTHVEANEERNIPEDYTIVRGAMFNFRNDLLPMDLTVRAPGGMSYFESLDIENGPIYTNIMGVINCSTQVREQTVESAWGEPMVKTFERKVREWTITNAAKVPYEFGDDAVMTMEDVAQMQANREVHLAEQKKRSDDYKASRNAPAAQNTATPAAPVAKKAGFSF